MSPFLAFAAGLVAFYIRQRRTRNPLCELEAAALRLLQPAAAWKGQTSGTPNHELAQERLLEQLRSGEVHESLVEPSAQAA